MKQKVLEALRDLGFLPEESSMGYEFYYEGRSYTYHPTDDYDASILHIVLPYVIHIDESHRAAYYGLMNEVNLSNMFVKAVENKEYIFLSAESCIMGDADLKQTLVALIFTLNFAAEQLLKMQAQIENATDDASEASA